MFSHHQTDLRAESGKGVFSRIAIESPPPAIGFVPSILPNPSPRPAVGFVPSTPEPTVTSRSVEFVPSKPLQPTPPLAIGFVPSKLLNPSTQPTVGFVPSTPEPDRDFPIGWVRLADLEPGQTWPQQAPD